MIAFVAGRVAAITPTGAVVEVGGVGMEVQCAPATLARLRVGEVARLPTSLVVREDSLTLFGFSDDDERTVFELLQTASGVGPRLAQAMLAVHPPAELRRAVAADDFSALAQVPGIGRKTAQRICLELKDRLAASGGPALVATAGGGASGPGWRESLHEALLGLGWSTRDADDALAVVAPEATAMVAEHGAADVGALLRLALRSLSRA